MISFIGECIALFFKVGIGFLALSVLGAIVFFIFFMGWRSLRNVGLGVEIPDIDDISEIDDIEKCHIEPDEPWPKPTRTIEPIDIKDETEPKFRPNKLDDSEKFIVS